MTLSILPLLLAAAPALSQELVDNGSFEDPAISGWSVYASIPGWTVDAGPGIEIQSGVVITSYDGNQHIELDSHGATDSRTTISQEVATCDGGTYSLSLAYTPRPSVANNDIEVSWNGTLLDTLSGTSAGWVVYEWEVTADADTATLTLADVSTADTLGGLLDAVSVISLDADCDGVLDDLDVCEDTVVPEDSVPSVRLGTNRWALVDDDWEFDTTASKGRGPGRSYTLDDTAGCSCEQIIDELSLGAGHTKFGCSISAMDDWTSLVEE